MKVIQLLFLMTLLGSVNAHANENVIGTSLSYSTQEFSVKDHTTNDGDAIAIDLYYRKMLNPYLGIEGGWLATTGGVTSALVGTLSEIKDAQFNGSRLGVYAEFPFTSNVALYSKLAANYYKVEYSFENIDYEDSKIGGEVAVGAAMSIGSVSLNLEYKYLQSTLIKSKGIGLGLSVHF
ncbi:TPA: porin family protein [Vibrio vulnificus]